MTGTEGRPSWWTPRSGEREVLLSLAATPGRLPAAVATRLAEGRSPASLLRNHSPDPGAVAAQLDALGLRFLVPGDDGWPLAATPPDPPCAWLFVDGPAPPEATASVAVVGGRRASPLRRAAARSIGAGLARAGYRVVSGGAAGVDAAAHAGALDAGGITVVVLGCGLDVPYPRVNLGLFAGVRAAGGTLASEHPPGTQPRAANFLPRNRLIAALSAAVVVVEAAEDSGSLSTARAAGSRGVGHVLVLPGAPWDPGAAGCNQLIRDGATLVRSLADILEELGATFPSPATTGTTPSPATTGTTAASPGAGGRHATDPGAAGGSAWSGLDAPARAVLTALIDGQLLSPGRLAAAADLSPAVLDSALLDLELAGLIRRTTAGVQAVGLPRPRTARPPRPPNPEGDDSPPGAAGTGVPGTRVAGTRAAGTRAAGTEATSTGPTGTEVAGTRAAGTGSAGAGAAGPGGSPRPRGPP